MRCFVPFCKNTSDNVSEGRDGQGISFHSFPSEVHLRAAWLRALGKKVTQLPERAVVCSQHFLNEYIYETEGGLSVIAIGAIPSTVQVCTICLDTESKLFLMNKHKLQEAYEKLTGHPVTRQHIKRINRTKHQLNSNMVLTTLGPDHWDLHILEHPSEDKQTELEETDQELKVSKTEDSDEVSDSMSVDEDTGVTYEDVNNGNDFLDPLKCGSATFQCMLCLEEFSLEQAFMRHMTMHIQNGDWDGEYDTTQEHRPHTAVSASSSHSSVITENKPADPSLSTLAAQTKVAALSTSVATNDENKVHATEEADTIQKTEVLKVTDGELENQSSKSTNKINVNINEFKNCVVKLYDIFTNQKVLPQKSRKADMVCESQKIASKDSSYQATSQNEVLTTEYIVPSANISTSLNNDINIVHSINSLQNSLHTKEKSFTCDICRKKYNRKSLLVKHIKAHTEVKPFSCTLCDYKCRRNCDLVRHMRTHTGIKQFSCTLCEFKFAQNSHLVLHMRTHSGIKLFSCTLCDYKCARKDHLEVHIRTHTGIKPFSCDLCDYKCAQSSQLLVHFRTHTGIKPFSCTLCDYKCARKDYLEVHIRTHTGIKPFSCDLCDYKCAQSSQLMVHLRTHTGIKPFSCKLCDYKCIQNSHLVNHMRNHTGIKPFPCTLCNYKCARKNHLVMHLRTHTGIKPSSCK